MKYHLRHIIMKLPASGLQEEKLSVMKKMEGVLSMLKKGQSFEHAARMYSQSPAAAAGGDLGMFKLSQLSPLIQDAIKSVKAGEFTGVLDTDQGFQIFYVQDIVQTPGKPLTEVSKVIEEKLYNEVVEKKFQLWLEDLRKRSAIKIIK
ncbi:MAG: peptidylprolyl isomerase [Desulfobacterales bacterium]|nr:peptidylprolyl isomerase [Desulfobacterales bacterium]